MRRLFYQRKLYDYTSENEAFKHIDEMKTKGWIPVLQDDCKFVYKNGDDTFPFSVEFSKQH